MFLETYKDLSQKIANPDIVRELKLKLMRFRNDKKLPRAEVNRILYELNDLGY